MRYLVVLLALMVANVAQAVDCHEPPTCESLGYSKTPETNCAANGFLNCPFDPTYTICVQHNCATLGFTNTDKASWCAEIISCKDDKNYTLCACALPRPEPCKVGSVYYANGTCSSVENYQGCGTPVGVVYYVSDGGAHGKVINLHDLGKASSSASFDPANPYQKKTFQWGSYSTDISGLTNWECSGNTDYLTVAKTGEHSNPFWSAGMSYTETIAKAQSNDLQYAAAATLAFYPPDVPENDPIVGAGKWYLPTLGELMDLYGYNYTSGLGNCTSNTGANGNTKQKVNATLQALKDKSAGNAETLANGYYWSSSKYDSYDSWRLYMSNGNRYHISKTYTSYVRASLEF